MAKKLTHRIIRTLIAKPLNSVLKRVKIVTNLRQDIKTITYYQHLSRNNFIVELYDGVKVYVP